ncbi:MAG TPA: hypothetical protein VIM44_08695, partial [Rariglobus sp.]
MGFREKNGWRNEGMLGFVLINEKKFFNNPPGRSGWWRYESCNNRVFAGGDAVVGPDGGGNRGREAFS